jgi:hypothetical protein
VLFERAPPETLSFLVYGLYVGAAGLGAALYAVAKFKGFFLIRVLAMLAVFLMMPLIVPAKIHIGKFFFVFIICEKRKK